MKYYSFNHDMQMDIERVLKRYPRNKQMLDSIYDDVVLATHPTPSKGNSSSENKPQSVTEGKALQLMNPYYDRIKREVYAVEKAVDTLDPIKLEIIRKRYWTQEKTVAFKYIDVPYASNTQRYITRKVLYLVGIYMGLIEVNNES